MQQSPKVERVKRIKLPLNQISDAQRVISTLLEIYGKEDLFDILDNFFLAYLHEDPQLKKDREDDITDHFHFYKNLRLLIKDAEIVDPLLD